VLAALHAAGLRAEFDDRAESVGRKIREAELRKVPFMLVVGDRVAEQGTVSVRARHAGDQGSEPVADLVARLADRVARREPKPSYSVGVVSQGDTAPG
jgi:threonyl-tRNA synthetase